METLEFYIVRSKDGKYLRSKGYGGYRQSWVEELKKAKVYTKKGPACAQVTWWATNYPDYGVPDLIPITGTLGDPIPQELRVLTSLKKKQIAETKRELETAMTNVKTAQRILQQVQSGSAERGVKHHEEIMKKIEEKLKDLQK